MKNKIVYIVSNIDKAVGFEWIADKIDSSKFQLYFIILNPSDSYLHKWLKSRNISSYYIKHCGKKSFISSLIKILFILKKLKPDVVHTHLLEANLIGLTAAKILGVKKRVYTRHHSTFHHDYFPKGVKYDKWANYMATQIIAISRNVQEVLLKKEGVLKSKTTIIYHGFDFEKFQKIDSQKIISLKSKYNISHNHNPVIGVIARHIKWKGIKYIIEAFKILLIKYPKANLILANSSGPHHKCILDQLNQLNTENYTLIKFEPDLFTLYQLFDVYVHTPIDDTIEAFGQTYVEALAAGIPSVFTLSGVAKEFIKDQKNAFVVGYKNSKEIYHAIESLLENKPLRKKLIENGKQSIKQFNLDLFIKKLEKMYE